MSDPINVALELTKITRDIVIATNDSIDAVQKEVNEAYEKFLAGQKN